jgi:hypothetical protein
MKDLVKQMKEIDSDMPNVMMDVLMKEQQQKNTKK